MLVHIKLDPGATLPRYAHATDAGADLTALRTYCVLGNGTEHELRTYADCLAMQDQLVDCAKVKIDTGVHAQPEDGYYLELVPNSRLAKLPFIYANSIGIIDPDYRGSIRVVLNTINRLTPADLSNFLPGCVVGQLIVRKRHHATFMQVDSLTDTERGNGGFGSTAKLPIREWLTLPAEKLCRAKKAQNAKQNGLSCTGAQQTHQDLFNSNGN